MYGVEQEVTLMGAARNCQPTQPWVDFIHQQAESLGEFNSVIDNLPEAAGSEDATYMMERVKEKGKQASYIIFGTDLSAGHHNEKFDFDENIMPVAVKTLATLALNLPMYKEA